MTVPADDLAAIFNQIPHDALHRAWLAEECRRSLHTFIRTFWHVVEPGRAFVDNWHIHALCAHLEAVTSGQITRVLFNVPPGAMKSLLVNVFWPAWEWGPQGRPWLRYLSASYSEDLTVRDNRRCRAVIGADLYQSLWGDVVQIDPRQDATGNYATMAKGWRIATSVGVGTGERADRVIIDDPHSVKTADSETIRSATLQWWREVIPTRVNDPATSAFVVIMQRVHEADVSGDILEQGGWTHVMIPMRFDPHRAWQTTIGSGDPRRTDGELYWPQRFPEWTVHREERVMGPFAVASQFQQSPTPRGGGIILREWWKVWPPEGQEDSWTHVVPDGNGRMIQRAIYPDLDYVLLSVDTAYTMKEENDWSACTVWGSFNDASRNPKIILLEAWRERLEMRALVLKIIDTARRRKADGVLIEAKASGLSVIQEMRRLMQNGEFTIFADLPKGDKVARLHAVSAAFSDGLVYAPSRKWADMVIDECASAPRSKWMDLCDTVSAGVKKLRELGVVQHADEAEDERLGLMRLTERRPTVREQYGV